MSSTDITYKDIVEWNELIERAKKAHDDDNIEEMIKCFDFMRKDMIFLVEFVNSLLRIEVSDDVYDRVRERRNG